MKKMVKKKMVKKVSAKKPWVWTPPTKGIVFRGNPYSHVWETGMSKRMAENVKKEIKKYHHPYLNVPYKTRVVHNPSNDGYYVYTCPLLFKDHNKQIVHKFPI